MPQQDEHPSVQTKSSQNSQQQRLSINYLPTSSPIQTTIRASFYPSQSLTSQKALKPLSNQKNTQHIHVPPPPSIPQLKSHQITINLPPPDIQRIVQNPSPLLPSQSRVIVTAKASVSDESGRPLNASQLITIPLPTIPSNYDDYKEGDESFDPFYRDVPKIRNDRRILISRRIKTNERTLRKKRSTNLQNDNDSHSSEVIFNAEIKDIEDLKANLPFIKAILFGLPLPEVEERPDKEKVDYLNNTFTSTETPKKFLKNSDSELQNKNSTFSREKVTPTSVENENFTKPERSKFSFKSNRYRNRSKVVNPRTFSVERKTLSSITQRLTTFSPIIVHTETFDTETKDTVQLFLRTTENNDSISSNTTLTGQQKLLIPLNDDTITDERKAALSQTQSSSNLNKYNREEHRIGKIEDQEELLLHRNDRLARPRPSRYYDEYDVSESIEVSSRQRSNRLRQRPKDRRINNYRNRYLDEDVEYEYDERNSYRNHENVPRRIPDERRAAYRNRNRHFDYDDNDDVDDDGDIVVGEKPDIRMKDSSPYNRSRGRSYYERYPDERRRRPDVNRRKNRRRRPPSTNIHNLSPIKTAKIEGQVLLEEYQTTTRNIDIGDKMLHSRLTDKNEQSEHKNLSSKKRLNTVQRGRKLREEDENPKTNDYLDPNKPISNDYYEVEPRGFDIEYVDYEDYKYQNGRSRANNRRNKSRFENEYKSNSRRKTNRRNKSRKFLEETGEDSRKEINTEFYDVETTTVFDGQDYKTTTQLVEYTIPAEVTAFHDYDDYNQTKTTLKTVTAQDTELPENKKITTIDTTEGVYRFTDELAETTNNNDEEEKEKQRDAIIPDEEDYVDDNYEPESYTVPEIPQTSTVKFKEKNRTFATLNVQVTKNSNKDISNTDENPENKEYEENYYEDGLESTTISVPSEEDDDPESTTVDIFTTTFLSSLNPRASVETTSEDKTIPTITPGHSITTSTTTTTKIPSNTRVSTSGTMMTTTPIYKTSHATENTAITTDLSTVTNLQSTTIIDSTTTLRSKILSTTSRVKNKFFKPLAFRKNYLFTPSATTPNTVNIRRGQPLTGPKPTKPPLSYNELAPKPVIRRLPLLSRTTTTTTTTTTSEAPNLEEKFAADLPKPIVEGTIKNTQMNSSLINNSRSTPDTPESITNLPLSDFMPTNKIRNNQGTTTKTVFTPLGFVNSSSLKETITEKITHSEEHNLGKEVPKKHQDSYYDPQLSDDSEETIKSETESTTYNFDPLNSETTTKTVDRNFGVQATTFRNFRPDRRKLELTSVKSQIQKTNQGPKQTSGFNCLEKEMYQFYGDVRDCRLFHYCSPGFTSRQVLDFRFICEDDTIFDEESQSCKHDVPNLKCIRRNQ